MSWLFSRALVEAYSADTCSDGAPSAQSNGNPIQQAYCAPDKMTAFSRLSRFGMTFAPLTEDRGAALLTLFQADSRVRTSAPLGGAQASMVRAADFGVKWHESSAKYDPASSSWKTHHSLWEEVLPWSSVILPRWGMTRTGLVFQHPTSERPISGTASGLWQTPVADDACNRKEGELNSRGEPKLSAQVLWPTPTVCGNYNRKGLSATSGDGLATAVAERMNFATPQARNFRSGQQSRWDDPRRTRNLNDQIAKFPTPTKSDHKGSGPTMIRSDGKMRGDRLDYCLERNPDGSSTGGQLNPTWVEWLMGWPLGWTDLKPLAMDRFLEWQQQHSACYEE